MNQKSSLRQNHYSVSLMLTGNSNLIRTDFDEDADGNIDRRETYTYDSNRRVSQTRFDDDNSCTADRAEAYT